MLGGGGGKRPLILNTVRFMTALPRANGAFLLYKHTGSIWIQLKAVLQYAEYFSHIFAANESAHDRMHY